MPTVPRTGEAQDCTERLDELVAEMTARLEAGEDVDVDALAADSPAHIGILKQLLPTLEAVVSLKQSGAANSSCVAGSQFLPTESYRGALGDFRIIREIGRGGMGIVYAVEQISLNRQMALKVLPFASILDERQLQRFKREAQAAAHLKHPHIVGVHSVGCERGVHYYAMEYIAGQSLAEWIAQLRADQHPAGDGAATRGPTESSAGGGGETLTAAALSTQRSRDNRAFFQSVAQIGQQAAAALEYAHTMGIVHRDVKPSNLLLNPSGHLWVTDFGLAMTGGDASLTATGDVLGTLRYMSPEQIQAEHGVLDHRTDVYSLGITLYELLTLKPAFPSNARQQLLRQIPTADPRPPRELEPAIPRDLETIILKAIAKEPLARYTTAGAMAEDLGRFLEDRPIRAKRPSTAERTTRWMRRHMGLVLSIVVVLAVTLIFLAVTLALVGREQTKTVQEQQRAETNLDLALAALDEVYSDLIGEQLGEEPGLTLSQRNFLQKALQFYKQLAQQNYTSIARWPEAAAAYRKLGQVYQDLGDMELAENAYRRAIAILQDLPGELEPRHLADLAHAEMNLGCLLMDPDFPAKVAEAERLLQSAINLFVTLQSGNGDANPLLAYTKKNLGEGRLQLDRYQEAEKAFLESLDISESLLAEQPDSFMLQMIRGDIFFDLSTFPINIEEKIIVLRQAIEYHQAALALQPDNRQARAALSKDYYHLGEHLMDSDPKGAPEAWSHAIHFARGLVDDFPNVPDYQSELAIPLYNCATVLERVGKSEESEKYYRQALPLFDDLVKKHPQKRLYRHCRARTQYNLAMRLVKLNQNQEARQLWQASLSDWVDLAARFPDSPLQSEFQSRSGATLNNLGLLAEDPQEAIALFNRAIEHQQIALRQTPRYEYCQQFLGQHYKNLATAYLKLQDYCVAADVVTQLVSTAKASRYQQAASILEQCAQLAAKDSQLDSDARDKLVSSYADLAIDYAVLYFAEYLDETGDPKECSHAASSCWSAAQANADLGRSEAALSAYEQTIAMLLDLVEHHSDVPEYERALSEGYYKTGLFHDTMGQVNEAESNLLATLRLCESLVHRFPDSAEDQKALVETCNTLAVHYRRHGRLDDAEQILRRLLAMGDELGVDIRDTADYFCNRGGALHNLGNIYFDRGDYDSFCRLMHEAMECQRQALAREPDHVKAIEYFNNHITALVICRIRQGEYEQAAAAAEELAATLPNRLDVCVRAAEILIYCAELSGSPERDQAVDPSQVESYLQRAKKILSESANAEEKTPEVINRLAWLLASTPFVTLRDIPRANRLADELVAAFPERAAYWRTTGLAAYRSEKWTDAIAALNKVCQLTDYQNPPIGLDPQGQPLVDNVGSEFFLLAMSHWQLDERDQARKWYDKAIEWIEENILDDEELDRFRAEATDLLEINKNSPPPKERPTNSNELTDSSPAHPDRESDKNADAND